MENTTWLRVTVKLTVAEHEQIDHYDIALAGRKMRDVLDKFIHVGNSPLPLKYEIMDVKEVSSCFGCRNNSPAQRDHMDYGGCLDEEN